jgi:hypothetical protein
VVFFRGEFLMDGRCGRFFDPTSGFSFFFFGSPQGEKSQKKKRKTPCEDVAAGDERGCFLISSPAFQIRN